jgi:hypothetical protein
MRAVLGEYEFFWNEWSCFTGAAKAPAASNDQPTNCSDWSQDVSKFKIQ